MKRIIFLLFTVFVTLFIMSSCTIVKNASLDFSIRMTAEQIRLGTFTGGRLIFSNNVINQLEPGMLIPIMDKRQGFAKAEDSENYIFKTLEVYYGYYYVVDATSDALTLDYLLYNTDGKIVDHDENIIIVADSGPDSSTRETPHGLVYQTFTPRDSDFSGILEGCTLLSFPGEIPDEQEQQYFDTDEIYRTVIFRLQKSATQPYDYQSGVLAVYPTEPVLILGTHFYDNVVSDESQIKIKDPDLPLEISPGDYILDTHGNSARKVTNVNVSDDLSGFTVFHTDKIHVQKILGALEMNLEGDLAEVIARFGTDEQRQTLETLLQERSYFDIWNASGEASLWKGDTSQVDLELDYNCNLGASIFFNAKVDWSETSATGRFTIDSNADYGLVFKLLGVDPGSKMTGKFITIPIKIPIEKLTAGFIINLVADYESTTDNASIVYETKMKTGDGSFGAKFDAGVRLEFIWGWLPIPQAWCTPDVIYAPFPNASFEFLGTEFQQLRDNSLKIGLQLNVELNLLGAITFNEDFNLGIVTDFIYDSIDPNYHYWAEASVYSSIDNYKIGIGIPFTSLGYTWDMGTIWDDKSHIVSIPVDGLMAD